MPQNIAEGNGKRSGRDRRRFFEIARGSAFECASILDILVAYEAISAECSTEGRRLLLRIVPMLSRMTERRGGEMRDGPAGYGEEDGGNEDEDEHEQDTDR